MFLLDIRGSAGLFADLFFLDIVDGRRATTLVSRCERNWGEYKIPVGRDGGGHGGRKK